MRNNALFALLITATVGLTLAGCGTTRLDYPVAVKGDTVDVYHGVSVADPYRGLEDPDAPETRAWIEAQQALTESFLATIPRREAIRKRLTSLWNCERRGVPIRRSGRFFYTHNTGLQNQAVLHVADDATARPRVVLDPNKLSADGTVSLSSWVPSEDGKWLAYALSSGGSDWLEWRVRNVDTGKELADRLAWSKFSGASWSHDSRGFFYSRYDAPLPGGRPKEVLEFQKLYYHQVGTKQSEDVLICQDLDHADRGFSGSVTDDGAYLGIGVWKGTLRKNLFWVKPLGDPRAKIIKLIDRFEATFRCVGNDGTRFWFLTSLDAPLNRVIEIDLLSPGRSSWKEIIPEARSTLQDVSVAGGRFIARYLEDARSRVKIFRLDGTFERELELPGIGTVGRFVGRQGDPDTYFRFVSFTSPGAIYRFELASGRRTVYFRPRVDFNPDDYVTHQVRYKSGDGTEVPMFITHKAGLILSGKHPTLLYGYGGFNVSLTPGFFVGNLVWMEMGGVFAQPNIRGGGEFGRDWHLSGTKLRKQNVFDDFIAAAEWLIERGYTCSSKLAISGASNGGLLVGACMTQRPELFGACLPAVGVMDMLRFPKFTAGHFWVSDYGSPRDPEQFRTLYAYSPLHALKEDVDYPATLITTADHDDRVVPAHSFKFAARLQECQGGNAPVLIRIETRAGHGAGKPTSKQIAEETDVLAFLVKTLGMKKRPR